THLGFGSMLAADGKPFKTRDGGTVKLKSLLDEAVARARRVVESQAADGAKGFSEAEIDDIEIGNVPSFIVDIVEGQVEDAVDEALENIDLSHTYTPTLTEGNAQIDGVP
ncbi:MAG: arginine--tRNA ligase, partial [Chloroflexi bacterium]|nr:arginine--tRNA ligase [Chloroflexota bacterium]